MSREVTLTCMQTDMLKTALNTALPVGSGTAWKLHLILLFYLFLLSPPLLPCLLPHQPHTRVIQYFVLNAAFGMHYKHRSPCESRPPHSRIRPPLIPSPLEGSLAHNIPRYDAKQKRILEVCTEYAVPKHELRACSLERNAPDSLAVVGGVWVRVAYILHMSPLSSSHHPADRKSVV